MNENQKLKDMLNSMQSQRNSALDVIVVVQAEIAAKDRLIESLQAEIAVFQDKTVALKAAEQPAQENTPAS